MDGFCVYAIDLSSTKSIKNELKTLVGKNFFILIKLRNWLISIVYVKCRCFNVENNIDVNQFYTVLFLFWKYVRYTIIHFKLIDTHFIISNSLFKNKRKYNLLTNSNVLDSIISVQFDMWSASQVGHSLSSDLCVRSATFIWNEHFIDILSTKIQPKIDRKFSFYFININYFSHFNVISLKNTSHRWKITSFHFFVKIFLFIRYNAFKYSFMDIDWLIDWLIDFSCIILS